MVEAAMNAGITTWDELPPCDGNLLLIINSASADTGAVEIAFDALVGYAGAAAIHVIAEPSWGPWLAARGVPADRVRFTTDDHGRLVELNHFLDSPDSVLWIVPRQFRVIVGSSAHNLHNEEVKELFERRVCLVLGDGRLFAHALPSRYLAVFDLAALVVRFGRHEKTEEYRGRCQSFVRDCHAAWLRHGAPTPADRRPAPELVEMIAEHFGRDILRFDEESPVLACQGRLATDLETLGLRYRTVLHVHDETLTARYRERAQAAAAQAQAVATRDSMLVALQDERNEAVAARDALLAEKQDERNQAVATRDALLAELRSERDQAVSTRDGILAAAQTEHAEVVAARDALLASLQAERDQAVATRDRRLAELQAEQDRAAGERDRTIASLQSELQFLTRGWRRWVVKPRE